MEVSHQKKAPRLYVKDTLVASRVVPLTDDQCHYLLTVLRQKEGDRIHLFNGKDGEWYSSLHLISKKKGVALCKEQIRPQYDLPFVSLAFSPLKKHRQDLLIEKVTELGVTHLLPVMFRYTNMISFNEDKIYAQTLEASEQSERLSVPVLEPLRKLEIFLKEWQKDRILYVALERISHSQGLKTIIDPKKEGGFLIGPEGGFAQEEMALLETYPFVKFFSLGSLILRAETAAIVCVGLYFQLKSL